MHDYWFHHKRKIKFWCFILMFFFVPAGFCQDATSVHSNAAATTTLQETVNGLHTRFSDAQDSAQNVLNSLPGSPGTTGGVVTFFSITNIGLWLLYLIVIGLIILLWSIRRNIQKAQYPVIIKRSSAQALTVSDSSEAVPVPHLVHSPRIVKIKVRKIRQSRKS